MFQITNIYRLNEILTKEEMDAFNDTDWSNMTWGDTDVVLVSADRLIYELEHAQDRQDKVFVDAIKKLQPLADQQITSYVDLMNNSMDFEETNPEANFTKAFNIA